MAIDAGNMTALRVGAPSSLRADGRSIVLPLVICLTANIAVGFLTTTMVLHWKTAYTMWRVSPRRPYVGDILLGLGTRAMRIWTQDYVAPGVCICIG